MTEKRTEQVMSTHQRPHILEQWGQPQWETRQDGHRHCSYCGSLHLDDVLVLMVKPGTKYSGSDWKYGWPHKFYIGPGKFYAEHLADATEDQLVLWNRVIAPLVGVKYVLEAPNLLYKAPYGSFQTWGTVGQNNPLAPEVPQSFIDKEPS